MDERLDLLRDAVRKLLDSGEVEGVLALRAAHRYGWGKAVLTLLIPVVVIAGLVICVLLLLGPVIGETYQQILEQAGGF